MVSPPSDAAKPAAAAVQPNRSAQAGGGSQNPQQGAAAAAAPAVADRANISPLDLAGALQILLAEVRAAMDLSLMGAAPPSAGAATPLQAARDIVEQVLLALPEHSQAVALWSEALPRADAALSAGIERALAIIEVWQDVPPAVAASAREAGALARDALSEAPLNPIWLRPEFAALAPRLTRLRRRRRALRRRLTDPDYRPTVFDDADLSR